MPNLAVRRCGKCGEIGGDKTGFGQYCIDEGAHEPEIIEVSPPLDPTDVYVVGAGAEAVAFTVQEMADQYVANQDGDPAVQTVAVHAPASAVTTIGEQLNETNPE